MKTVLVILFSTMFASCAFAADYDLVKPGDVYFINKFGRDNPQVEVVGKIGGQQVNVRDLATREISTVSASRLLKKQELRQKESENRKATFELARSIFCGFSPETCRSEGSN